MGVAGVAWRTKILSMKVLHSGTGNSVDIANGCEKLVELKLAGNPILVSNHSYGGNESDPIMEDGFRLLDGADIFAAVAAGNSNVNIDGAPFAPAVFDFSNIISTMASDISNLKASFSCFGIAKTDIAAPGVGVLSTTPNNTYSAYSGTSMATPHVCGVALLLRARNPSLSAHAIRDLILDPASYDSFAALSNNNTSARINLNKAIRNPRLFESPFRLNRWPTITNITPFVIITSAAPATITANVSDPDGDALRFSSVLSGPDNDRSGYLAGLLKKNGLSLSTVGNTIVISGNPSAYQLSSDVMMACSDNRGGSGFGTSGFEIARNSALRKPVQISTWIGNTNAEWGSFSWTFDVLDPNKDNYSYWITWCFSGGNSMTFFNGTPGPWTVTQPFGRTMTNFNVRVFVMDKWLNYSNSETLNFYPTGYVHPECSVTTSSTEGNVPFDVKFDLTKSTGPITHYLIFDLFGTLQSTIGATQSLTFSVPGVTFKKVMAYNVLTGDQDHKIVPVYSSRFGEFGLTNQPPPPPAITNLVAVTNLTAGFSGTTTVLQWKDNSTLEDRYMVEASYKSKFYTSPWVTIGTTGPNQDFFVHVPNVRRSIWSYRIKACGGQLCAPNSNIASVRVK
jgi:hypothetical protein